jgi:putative tryptophan/tyrosine transport system substrate-binding protein
MKRREFIRLFGCAAVWPLAAQARQPVLPVIGFVNSGSLKGHEQHLAAFIKGLGEAGYVEGRNVAIEYRWAENQNDRLSAMMTDLVDRRVAVIVATSSSAAVAAKVATTSIPIVFEIGGNPAEFGLLDQDNITGVAQLDVAVAPLRLQLLHQLAPKADVIALLVNPNFPPLAEVNIRTTRTTAQTLGLKLHVLNASTEHDLNEVFAHLRELRVGALVIASGPFFVGQQKQLAALALRYAVPTAFATREFVEAGGLMSYGGNFFDAFRECGTYAARILKGEKPHDLPVQHGTKVELFINRKSLEALGLKIPDTLVVHPDEVIE